MPQSNKPTHPIHPASAWPGTDAYAAERTAQPAANHWIAAGVQYEVLRRALPVIRHDLVGPLSVSRMGTAVLKRHLSREPLDAEGAIARVEQLDIQLQTLVEGIRALRHWDLQAGEPLPAAHAISAALDLVRPALALRGVTLQAVEGWESRLTGPSAQSTQPMQPDQRTTPYGALLYAVLAAIFYLQDDDSRRPAAIALDSAGDGQLTLQASGQAAAQQPPELAYGAPAAQGLNGTDDLTGPDSQPSRGLGMLTIDAHALQCLARQLAMSMAISPNQVSLQFPN